MTSVEYLVDTSAYVRLMQDLPLRAEWRAKTQNGTLVVCPVSELEILFSAKSMAHYRDTITILRKSFRWIVMPDRIFERAAEVQKEMTSRGCHRSAGPVDLLVAATAEEHKLTLLHYDAGFLSISKITGQAVEWVAEPGTVS